jgi:hypothetical protein
LSFADKVDEMMTLDKALDAAMQLSATEKEMLVEILWRRQIEERREEIRLNAQEAIAAFHAGELREETIEELIGRLI